MALKTLKGIKEIGGYKVINMTEIKEIHPELFNADGGMNWEIFERDYRPNYPIQIRDDKNSISFTIQNGPVKENGVNGCQVDTLIYAAKAILNGLNKESFSEFNLAAIEKLNDALQILNARTEDRVARGVEGTSQD